jgi:hypothetical protein
MTNICESKFKYEHIIPFLDKTYHTTDYESRNNLHTQIIDSFFENKKSTDKPKLIFTAGCYGSGKTYVLNYLQNKSKINFDEYVRIDPDEIRRKIPEYEQYVKDDVYTAGALTQKEAVYITDLLQYYALFNGYNIIIDGSMQDYVWYENHINWIRTKFPNYTLIIIFINSEWETIIKRENERCNNIKRCINKDLLKINYDKVQIAYDKLSKIVHHSFIINNEMHEPNIDFINIKL